MSGYNNTIIINYNCIYFCNIIIIIINSATLIIMMFLGWVNLTMHEVALIDE